MKKKYMIKVKRLMFWHFNKADIRETLEDISSYFDSALENGISENEAATQYGKAEDTVNDLVKNNSRSKKIRAKFLLIISMLVLTIFLPENFSRVLMPLVTAVFFWFISGNSCLIGIVPYTKSELKRFAAFQILILCLFTAIQACAIFFFPSFLMDTLDGKSITGIIYITIFVLLATAAISALDMFNGNLYMFFLLIQSISLILDLVWYRKFLFSIETLKNTKFIFYSYLLSISLMAFWWIGYYKKSKTSQNIIRKRGK